MLEAPFINWYFTLIFFGVIMTCLVFLYFQIRRINELKQLERLLLSERPAFIECLNQLENTYYELLESKEYISQYHLTNCREIYSSCLSSEETDLLKKCKKYSIKKAEHLNVAEQIKDLDITVARLNKKFIQRRCIEEASLLDNIHSNPLTDKQKEAVVTEEVNNLIIAGAGTGKTATAIAKIIYLLKRGLVCPEEILVLAFNKSAVQDFKEKLKQTNAADYGQESVEVSTFNRMGNMIVGHAEGKRRSISELADPVNKKPFDLMTREFTVKCLSDPAVSHDLINFFSDLLDEEDPADVATSNDEYCQLSQTRGLDCLAGLTLKSREEVSIANYLTLKSVKWEYEKSYEVDTATEWKQQYKPDFYLTDYDIYLEHFGVDSKGNTRAGIDAVEYNKSIKWKRKLHAENGTTLVETNSGMRYSGEGLAANLDKIFSKYGIKTRHLTVEEIEELYENKSNPLAQFDKLLQSFLALYKANGWSDNEKGIEPKRKRNKVFYSIFTRYYKKYQSLLDEDKAIDFHDQINLATTHLRKGRYSSPYKYIIVDEFQDASQARLEMVLAMRSQHVSSKLFVVGDDWQSIYRFAGSDVSVMTDFEGKVGYAANIYLDRTFRFNQQLASISSHFIQQNESQIKKEITSVASAEDCVLQIIGHDWEGENAALEKALQQINVSVGGEKSKVFILGRNTYAKPNSLSVFKKAYPNFDISFTTVHRSKGLEADFVIIPQMNAHRMGFPSLITDDSVLSLVLPEDEMYLHAEERRLFYVALTRARKKVIILTNIETPSSFVMEIRDDDWYSGRFEESGIKIKRLNCPICKGLTIRSRQGKYGTWYQCSNSPMCKGELELCDVCSKGAITNTGGKAICSSCGNEFIPCPDRSCTGRMKERHGKNGAFLGCSNYSKTQCRRTMRIRHRNMSRYRNLN